MHRISQLLDEEDNIKFMTMIDASTIKNDTKEKESHSTKESEIKEDSVKNENNESQTIESVQKEDEGTKVSIKTETRTGYVNIDGTEREKNKNESMGDILKERISTYYNNTKIDENNKDAPTESPLTKENEKVQVEDIIVNQKTEGEKLQLPSTTKAKEVMKIFPKAWLDYLTSDWTAKTKCEPQHMLERIRKEKMYPEHPDVNKYSLLLTPAPSFLQRISLAGEFLNKKQLEL